MGLTSEIQSLQLGRILQAILTDKKSSDRIAQFFLQERVTLCTLFEYLYIVVNQKNSLENVEENVSVMT